jgi:predicted NUDIX family phosphoesterase
MEEDPNFKQLICYQLIWLDGLILEYTRMKQSGESRLRGKRSVGFGGHINPHDLLSECSTDLYGAYLLGAQRELMEEELIFREPPLGQAIVGLVNDDSNPVGQVHLGIVHIVGVDLSGIKVRDEETGSIAINGFRTSRAILNDPSPLEDWSHLVLKSFGALSAAARK